jgi:hypothetical protein
MYSERYYNWLQNVGKSANRHAKAIKEADLVHNPNCKAVRDFVKGLLVMYIGFGVEIDDLVEQAKKEVHQAKVKYNSEEANDE